MTEIEFVKDIEAYPELYDRHSINYMNQLRKIKLWAFLSQKHGLNDAKNKWKTIRGRYCRERNKMHAAAECGQKLATYDLFPYLSFLDCHLKHRAPPDSFTRGYNIIITNDKNIEDKFDESLDNFINTNENIENFQYADCGIEDGTPVSDHSETNESPIKFGTIEIERFTEQNESNKMKKKRKFELNNNTDKEISPKLDIKRNFVQSSVNDTSEIPKNIYNNNNTTIDDNDEEDLHFLKSISFKMKKMNESEKDNFKLIMLRSAINAVTNTKKSTIIKQEYMEDLEVLDDSS